MAHSGAFYHKFLTVLHEKLVDLEDDTIVFHKAAGPGESGYPADLPAADVLTA